MVAKGDYVYTAVLDKDCTEHIFTSEEDAIKYVTNGLEFLQDGEIRYIDGIGWYKKIKVE